MPTLSEKESFLLSELANFQGHLSPNDYQKHISQRELAIKTGLSIGLLNAVLRRLISSRYVRIKAFNKKKIQYLLTAKGASQIVRRSYQAIKNTIAHYQQLETGIHAMTHYFLEKGYVKFKISGEGELADMVSRVLKNDFRNRVAILEHVDGEPNALILNLTDHSVKSDKRVVNLLDYLHIN